MSTPITVGMPLSVQNPTVKWVFEPAVMFRSRVVSNKLKLKHHLLKVRAYPQPSPIVKIMYSM